MSRVRAYIKPFDDMGNYAADFVEVTDYVEKCGDITIDTDSSGYDIGIYRNSSVNLVLNNRDGLFSDVGTVNTMFKYTRGNSLVRVTWDKANFPLTPTTNDSMVDQYVSAETVLFEGLLNDDSLQEDAKQEETSFRVIGFETLFNDDKVSLNSFTLGDDLEEIIYAILNTANITSLLTISQSNINCGLNQVPDVVLPLENKSVKSVLDELLFLSNSILYIVDRVVYVAPRTSTPAVEFTFHGQNSNTGIENIINLKNITSGKNKLFNFFTWRDSVQTAARNQSIRKFKHRFKEITSELFTTTIKQYNIMQSLLDEFGFPKQEMDITVNLDYDSFAIQILDRVNMDVPLQYIEAEGFDFPICGVAICGEAVLPKPIFAFSMDPSKNFKVIKRTISPENRNISFRIREI